MAVTRPSKERRLRIEVTCRHSNGFYVAGEAVDGPKRIVTRAGTQFGAVGGMVYDVSPDGKVHSESPAKVTGFTRDLGLPQPVDRK